MLLDSTASTWRCSDEKEDLRPSDQDKPTSTEGDLFDEELDEDDFDEDFDDDFEEDDEFDFDDDDDEDDDDDDDFDEKD